eukprot:5067120-Prymnesium_polylepis.1
MVRDDLFLEPSSKRPSASAPPVVRGYLACTSEARSQALLQRAANQTARRRAEAAASRLPVLAVVYFGTHHERLGSLRAYELYFERVVYMSPSKAIATALLSTAALRPIVRAASYHCLQPNKVSYKCVAEVTAAHGRGTRGTLFFHFDFWVQPWALVAARSQGGADANDALLDTVWATPEGRIMQKQGGPTHLLPLSCFNATRPAEYRVRYPAWSWERDVPAVRAAAADAAARLGHRALGQGQLCIGWAD